jgi:hypothetical protein
MYGFLSVALSCAGTGPAMIRPLTQGILPNVDKGSKICHKNSPERPRLIVGYKRLCVVVVVKENCVLISTVRQ